MRKVISASETAKARKAIKANTGSIEDMLDAFEDRIVQLENFEDLNMSTDVYEDEEDIEECGDIYSSEEVGSASYFSEDGVDYYDLNNLMSEEDMYSEILTYMIDVMDQSDLSVEEAAQAGREWFNDLIDKAVVDIESGKAKSVYDR